MKILRELEFRTNLEGLDAAWEDPETFLFLPEKSAVQDDWLNKRLEQIPDDFRRHHFILLTSGSTGEPKLVIGLRAKAVALARELHKEQDSEAVQTAVCLLPLTYCYSFVNQWLWARVHDRELITTDGFARPDSLAEALASTHASMVCLVGAQVPMFQQHFPDQQFSQVIRVHFAGGRFPQEQLNQVERLFPSAKIYNNYGCAEAMPRLTLRRARDADDAADVGRPLNGIRLRVNGEGVLTFQSPFSAVAFSDASGFQQVNDSTWIPTGDLAEQLPNEHWRILGRRGEVFKRFGEKISLSNLLRAVGAAWPKGAAFYKDRDPTGEEAHVLILAPHPDKQQLRAILMGLRKDFPRTHWPLRIESVEAFPTLHNGKTDLLALAKTTAKQEQWRQRL